MGKRFGRYKFALKSLRNPATPGSAVAPPANSALDNFQKFAKEETVLSYPRADTSKQISMDIVGVNPFGLPDAATNVAIARVSQRAATKGGAPMKTACNQGDAETAVLDLRGFIPARAVIADEKAGATKTPKPSQITGVKYIPSQVVTYTFPYGKSTTSKLESEVRVKILAAASAFMDPPTITFKSEKY
jgi:hypothetical protein